MIKDDILGEYRLTPMQKNAIDWNNGSVIVLAGPGSGKTRVLTLRIARLLLESEEDAFRILGLTFTHKAADEMRSRIKDLVPNMGNRLFLGTFHSFCAEVLRNHGSHLDIKPDFTIYSNESDMEEIIDDVKRKMQNTATYEPIGVSKLLPIIQFLQKNLVMPEQDLTNYIKHANLRVGISAIYSEYFLTLKRLNALDFDSMILFTNLLFSKFPFIAKHYRMLYPYICVDEFQDTTPAQYSLIKTLTKDKHNNLFFVADDDQVIYQWNGASHKRITEFIHDFNSDIIQLPDNFRCPHSVVQLANKLIKNNATRAVDKLPTHAVKEYINDDIVDLQCFEDFEQESIWIANRIRALRDRDKKARIAVIARTNKLLTTVHESLKEIGIDSVLAKRKNNFESVFFSWLHNILKLANKRNDKKSLGKIISTFGVLNNQEFDIAEIIAWSDSRDGDYLRGFYKCLEQAVDEKFPLYSFRMELIEGKSFYNFMQNMIQWYDFNIYKKKQDDDFYALEKEAWQGIVQNIRDTLGNVEEIALGAFLQELDLVAKEKKLDDSVIQCITIHSAKGKEYEHVYLIGLAEDILPSFQSKNKGVNSVEMEEERRNCFVAITRTVEKLTLTYSSKYFGWQKKPSRFLFEMGLLEN